MKRMSKLLILLIAVILTGCTSRTYDQSAATAITPKVTTEIPIETQNVVEEEVVMKLFIGETEVPVTWESNESVEALKALLPLNIQMSMYGGFEQVGSIGSSIVRNDKQTTTSSGDIVLYSGNQIVVFYGSNSWAYTRLGHVELSAAEMMELLGNGDVTITISEE